MHKTAFSLFAPPVNSLVLAYSSKDVLNSISGILNDWVVLVLGC